MKTLLPLIALTALISCSFGKGKPESIKLSNVKFKSIFGYNTKDSLQAYCLLGTGFLRAPSSNADSLIDAWINNHPNANVIPVSTISDEPNYKLTYCWLADNSDTISNYLIKNGCFPGGTMMYPKSSVDNAAIKIHIDQKSYAAFIEQLKSAEIFAKEHKLGIWATAH